MSEKIKDGGPAFRSAFIVPAGTLKEMGGVYSHDTLIEREALSLRDWFAGMALQGMIASHGLAHSAWNTTAPDENAKLAYTIADAMLAARSK